MSARAAEIDAAPPAPEPDRIDGAPHPRDTAALIGQDAAQAQFLQAYRGGRLHHGWLITGPRGIGKATLAWRIARFLLTRDDGSVSDAGLFGDATPTPATPPDSLDAPEDHPALARIAALSDPNLFLLRRGYDDKKSVLKTVISVDDVRALKSFLTLSAADGGARVVVIDSMDEMNENAANALLKLLEEPPARVYFLMVAHQPSGLLPTIRSRCRSLRCAPLGAGDLVHALAQAGAVIEPEDEGALAVLCGGAVGEAIRLTQGDGLAIYGELVALFDTLPRLDRNRALALAESATGKAAQARFALILDLFDLFLARLARAALRPDGDGAVSPAERALFARLSPNQHSARRWASAQQEIGARARHGQAVNLDPAALILDMVHKIEHIASETVPAVSGRG